MQIAAQRPDPFHYLHLAADKDQAKGLIDSGAVAIAYGNCHERPRRSAPPRAYERSRRTHGRAMSAHTICMRRTAAQAF